MKLQENHYRRIEKLLPKQRGNVKIDNRVFLDAILYRCKNGCSWRDLPPEFGNWHVISMRFSRWTQNRMFDRIYAALSEDGLQDVTEYALDAPSANVHPDAFGCLKKRQTGTREVTRGLAYQDSRTGCKRYTHKRLYLVRRGGA